MEAVIPSLLIRLITISITFSCILAAVIQKLKKLPFIKKSWQVLITNFLLSFILGIPFGVTFYKISIEEAVWVGIFSFVGASSLYSTLKNQTIINYKPASVDEK